MKDWRCDLFASEFFRNTAIRFPIELVEFSDIFHDCQLQILVFEANLKKKRFFKLQLILCDAFVISFRSVSYESDRSIDYKSELIYLENHVV